VPNGLFAGKPAPTGFVNEENPCGSGLARDEARPDTNGIRGIKKGYPKVAFKKLERFFPYTAATGRM
jgi:hypothetical protein